MREYERLKELLKDFECESYDEKIYKTSFGEVYRRNYRMLFKNGYGFDVFFGDGSYGYEEGTLELAVIQSVPKNTQNSVKEGYDLHYSNPVAEGDVVGHLTADEAFKLIKEISTWQKDQKWPEYEEEEEEEEDE